MKTLLSGASAAIFLICIAAINSAYDAQADALYSEPPDEWHDDHCRVYRAEHEGHKFAVRQARNESRRVCLVDPTLNPDGCGHLACGK